MLYTYTFLYMGDSALFSSGKAPPAHNSFITWTANRFASTHCPGTFWYDAIVSRPTRTGFLKVNAVFRVSLLPSRDC